MEAPGLDEELRLRLATAGVNPDAFGDPAEAWHRLHDRFGTRATLLDRYSLEAAARAIAVDSLSDADRERLTMEVLGAHWGEFEIVGGSDRIVRDPIEVVDYNPEWPAQFAAWRDRLAAALGPTAVRIEHVGSTSVPGLAAKPIIDIQVSVERLEPLDSYRSALARIGYVHVPHPDDSFCPFFHRPAVWPHTHHVHVVEAGGEEERRTLAFRDYLREHAGVAREYEELKRRLAVRYAATSFSTRQAYADAKGEFISAVVGRAIAQGYPRDR